MNKRDIKYLVVHCTATPKNTTIKSIQNYWKNNLGWKNVGYHYIIESNGNIVQLANESQIPVSWFLSSFRHVSKVLLFLFCEVYRS